MDQSAPSSHQDLEAYKMSLFSWFKPLVSLLRAWFLVVSVILSAWL